MTGFIETTLPGAQANAKRPQLAIDRGVSQDLLPEVLHVAFDQGNSSESRVNAGNEIVVMNALVQTCKKCPQQRTVRCCCSLSVLNLLSHPAMVHINGWPARSTPVALHV